VIYLRISLENEIAITSSMMAQIIRITPIVSLAITTTTIILTYKGIITTLVLGTFLLLLNPRGRISQNKRHSFHR